VFIIEYSFFIKGFTIIYSRILREIKRQDKSVKTGLRIGL
jgi:hypothetical protein